MLRILLAGLTLATGARISQRRNDCDGIQEVVVNGKDFTEGLKLVCQHWPAKLGGFPFGALGDASRIKELFREATGPGGTLDRIKELRTRDEGRFCWRSNNLRPESQTERYDTIIGGVRYDQCPYGYKPAMFGGRFQPVCNSACGASTNPFPCGMGCASSLPACARNLLGQVAEVASAVGSTMSFFTQNEAISRTVDKVISFGSFCLDVLPRLLELVRRGASIISDREESAVLAVLLFQFVQEVAPDIRETVENMKQAVAGIADMMAELAATRFEFGKISPGDVVRGIVDRGQGVLDSAERLAKVFTHPSCVVANDIVFTIEEVGDDALYGGWVARGTMNGKPKYTRAGDADTVIEWNRRDQTWVMFKGVYSFNRKILYRNDDSAGDYPVTGWYADRGVAPVPEIIAVQDPHA